MCVSVGVCVSVFCVCVCVCVCVWVCVCVCVFLADASPPLLINIIMKGKNEYASPIFTFYEISSNSCFILLSSNASEHTFLVEFQNDVLG